MLAEIGNIVSCSGPSRYLELTLRSADVVGSSESILVHVVSRSRHGRGSKIIRSLRIGDARATWSY